MTAILIRCRVLRAVLDSFRARKHADVAAHTSAEWRRDLWTSHGRTL